MGASHEATFRQYLLLNLGGMRSTSNVVVVGHGMVGHRFVEALRSRDANGAWRVTVLAEETDAAYDRVGLTGYTEHWDRGRLALPGNDYRDDDLVELRLGTRVVEIDRVAKTVLTADETVSTMTRWCWPPARTRSCRRCRVTIFRRVTCTAPSTTSMRSGRSLCVPSMPAMRPLPW